jgi:hypothetical protein
VLVQVVKMYTPNENKSTGTGVLSDHHSLNEYGWTEAAWHSNRCGVIVIAAYIVQNDVLSDALGSS